MIASPNTSGNIITLDETHERGFELVTHSRPQGHICHPSKDEFLLYILNL